MILDRFKLDGRVAIVTGASGGLGAAFARGLAEAGADLVICARRVDRLASTKSAVEEIGRRCVPIETDVTDQVACDKLAEASIDEFGRLDILVNNAGLSSAIPATRESSEEFRRILDVNLFGSFWMAHAAARRMSAGGSIINIGSVAGFTTTRLPQAAYVTSKAALLGLTRELAREWSGGRKIRVNLLAPGFFPTEMSEGFPPAELQRIVADRIPMGRTGNLDEAVAGLLFLASDASSYVTGAALTIDGGFLTS